MAAARSANAFGPDEHSELTWLLHRASQRMGRVTGDVAAAFGLTLRDYIVLSAMEKSPGLTQTELGRAVGMDKSTLLLELDRLEKAGLSRRRNDSEDRRIRIPHLTAKGEKIRARVAMECEKAENAVLDGTSEVEATWFRRMLTTIIGDDSEATAR